MSDTNFTRERLKARLDELEAETRRYLDNSANADQNIELDQLLSNTGTDPKARETVSKGYMTQSET